MGDANLPKTQKISILFDRPMNINSCVQSFSVSPAVPGYFTLTDVSLTFTPSSLWNFGTYTYTLTKNCEAKDGSDLKELYSASFSVGTPQTAGDLPRLQSVTLYAGSSTVCSNASAQEMELINQKLDNVCMGAPLNNPITFRFSRAMDREKTEIALVFAPNFPHRRDWLDDQTLKVIPDRAFANQTRYNLTLAATAEDRQGTRLAEAVTLSFYVGSGNMVPELSNILIPSGTPIECMTGLAVNQDLMQTKLNTVCTGNPNQTRISLTFSRAMDPNSTRANIAISPNFSKREEWSPDFRTINILPDQKLVYGTRYILSVGQNALSADSVPMSHGLSFDFQVGGPSQEAPKVQAVGLASQSCSLSYPGIGSLIGADWNASTCFWDDSLPILIPSSYRFRAGDQGTGLSNSPLSCTDANTDNFRLIFSQYMDVNSTVNAIRLNRKSPPSTLVQLSTWNWSDCQTVYPFGCRVIDLVYAESEASCNGPLAFGNASTGGDFNLLRSDNMPIGFPVYSLSVDTSARDVLGKSLQQTFIFHMEAK
ncbi:Ig-like protein [Leptospira ryugenii]|uniref:Ig-like protein n=2 Tax=Leptospira ryugenii TaxID=1917863 RepID=A0A2P2E0N4_9LEPT|nr:Ig-like protein [Leptospira ryugenii]